MRTRLALAFALVALVSIVSMALALRLNAAREVRTFMYGGGMVGLENLVVELEDYYHHNGAWDGVILRSENGMGKGHGAGMMGQRLRLYDQWGNLVMDSAGGAATPLQDSDRPQAIQLSVDGQTVGYLLPEEGMGVAPGQDMLLINRLNNAALISALIAGLVSLVLAILLAYGLLRPVHELTRAAIQMARGELGVRVPARGPGEMASLGAAFNHMAASLQQVEESRRAMTADIAHELRTPLAVQRASLEALQDGVYLPTPENLQSLLEQNQLLTRLVEDLRTLALADAGQLDLELTPCDFPVLVQRILDRFRPQASARNIELAFIPSSSAIPFLSLDPLRIEQILSNLLTNALRHTSDGGRIECSLATSEHGIHALSPIPPVSEITHSSTTSALLTIHDTGPGIPPDALPHLFERFYRADPSRNRLEGGTGLGLAIARQLAKAHGGALVASNHLQGGAVFTLTLPVNSGGIADTA